MEGCEANIDERQDGELKVGTRVLNLTDCSADETTNSSLSISFTESVLTSPTALLKGLKTPSTLSTVLTISLCFSGTDGIVCEILQPEKETTPVPGNAYPWQIPVARLQAPFSTLEHPLSIDFLLVRLGRVVCSTRMCTHGEPSTRFPPMSKIKTRGWIRNSCSKTALDGAVSNNS
jgi:hypothetical protein